MQNTSYKKMAGTAAVFISADYHNSSPVERDGLIWNAEELHLEELPKQRNTKPAMATVLALEGLEDYEKPTSGDIREVSSMGIRFIYCGRAKAWVQID